mgnify:CR=1 FL=1
MKNNVFIQKAIQSLGGQTIYKVDPKTLDIILIKSDHSKEQLQQEANRIEEEWNQNKYQRDRAVAYDPIPEQLDQIYHDIDGWKARIKSVKDKYPKP